MNMKIRKIKQEECEIIASWNYPEDYQWTTLGAGSENEAYLLSEKHRDNHYFAICDGHKLLGFFSINDKIRQEVGALQLVIRPDINTAENQLQILAEVEKHALAHYPDLQYLNAVSYDYQTQAMELYQRCGFENKGPVKAYGHDMQSYEQEGFNTDGNGAQKQITMYILSKKIR